MSKIKIFLAKLFLQLPVLNRFAGRWFKLLGVDRHQSSRISPHISLIGNYSNLVLKANSEINFGCFFLAKDKIIIGENSTIAYQATILTSANPNGPYNKLSKIYPAMKSPVVIGDNVWIGARATILPGVVIGNFAVVAAGSLVNKDVPDYTVVAGVPARIIKKIDPLLFQNP